MIKKYFQNIKVDSFGSTLPALIGEFISNDFDRLCKYECDYDLTDTKHPHNTTVIDTFLYGDPSYDHLMDRIQEKKDILTQIEILLTEGHVSDGGILVRGLWDVINFLEVGLVNELIKGGYDVPSPDRDLAKLEEKIWGAPIAQSPDDLSRCSAYISQFESSSRLLEYCSHLGLDHSYQPQKNTSHDDMMIDRDGYVDLYQSVITDLYSLDAKVLVEGVSNIIATGDTLLIPDSPAYALMPRRHLLELLAHEIEVHLVTAANHRSHFSYLPISPKHLLREEGLALFMEYQVFGTTPSISTRSHVEILAGEVLGGDHFRQFMEFFGELHEEDPDTTYRRYLRRKRFYPFETTGVQHKDVAYDRGYHAISDYLTVGNDIRHLYAAHVPLDVHLDHKDTLLPCFFAQYCAARMSGEDDFLIYLQDKYASYPGMKPAIEQVDTQRLSQMYDRFSHLFDNR